MGQVKLIGDFSARSYQQSIFANCMDRNSLVVLPTGLGKTVLALMLAVYYFNKGGKKVLFLAPTKPLVEQHERSFSEFFENHDDFVFEVLTGSVSPKKRAEKYKLADFIFSTPQLIENDIVNRIVDPNDFSFVIFDEAHRGVGNYAYTFIAEQFDRRGVKILALTASPGTTKEEIKTIVDNLRIEHVEVRRYDDLDVKSYVKGTKIEQVRVTLPDEFKMVKSLLDKTYNKKLQSLKDLGLLSGKNINLISKRELLEQQISLRNLVAKGGADEIVWKAISKIAGIIKLQHGIELFESQEISTAYNYFYNFFREGGDKSKAVEDLIRDINFCEAFDGIRNLHKEGVKHPKLVKLKELVVKELIANRDLRIIVFSQYRDTAQRIVEELNQIREISASIFVGQAKRGDMKMSQKEQKQIIHHFKEGGFNVLVSTSVGEEGLDIPKVDVVFFYEPVASAIRSIQRIGRTGRFKQGKAYVLMSEGTRDIVTRHIAGAKEKRMYKALDAICEERKGVAERKDLFSYVNNDKEDRDERLGGRDEGRGNGDGRVGSVNDEEILVYVDNRENNDLIKELFKLPLRVEAKKLDVADVVISEHIAIERKSKKDFVNSIIDKRLFPQLMNLAQNYRRPLLIIEGDENIFGVRGLNPNVIRSTLSAITIDMRVPIIFTDSMHETAQMILTIAKRVVRTRKDISLVAQKGSLTEKEEMEKVISSIPKINVVSAKSLLKHFGSIKNLVNAGEEEILKCEGIGRIRAKYIVEFFEKMYEK